MEIFLPHFEKHLVVKVVQFALRCNLHADNERLEAFEDDGCITSECLVERRSV